MARLLDEFIEESVTNYTSLRYWCNCHVSWDHRQLTVPSPLPAVNFTLNANDAVRYYQNVCEYGYREGGWLRLSC